MFQDEIAVCLRWRGGGKRVHSWLRGRGIRVSIDDGRDDEECCLQLSEQVPDSRASKVLEERLRT